MTSRTAGLLFAAWADWDRLTDGLDFDTLSLHDEGSSSVAWSLAHVTNHLDGWINVRFQAHGPDPTIGDDTFSIGGSGAADWARVRPAVVRVREAARPFLRQQSEQDLDRTIAYDGSHPLLRSSGLSLRHAVLRLGAHHYLHLGEACTVVSRKRGRVPDFPGGMEETI